MKQKVDSCIPEDQGITELQATFIALYSLLLDRIENEPNKGLIINKGKPNQYKLRWKRAMYCLHELEDFFTLRDPGHAASVCERCKHWNSISSASPHLGHCKKKGKSFVHALSCCKDLKEYS